MQDGKYEAVTDLLTSSKIKISGLQINTPQSFMYRGNETRSKIRHIINEAASRQLILKKARE